MEPGQSGRARAAKAAQNADSLESQARELLHRAEHSRQVAGLITLGNDGEQIIGAVLEQLTPDGWVVLHDRRRQPGSPANLDHILVGPAGIFVIDAKNWTGGRLRLDDRGMALAKWRKDDELHAAKVDGDIVREHVAALGVVARTVAVLAFVRDMGLVGPVEHKQVVLLQRDQLLIWLRGLPTLITPGQVACVAAGLDALLPPRLTQRPDSRTPVSSPTPRFGSSGSNAADTGEVTQPLAAARARPVTAAMKRKDRARNKARQELKAGAVKLAILAVCIPVVPWVVQHVVSAATPHIISHLVPPTPTPTKSNGVTEPRPPGR